MMNCSDDKKMAMKKMVLQELLADIDNAESKKLMPKPAVAVEIESVKPMSGEGMGEKMDKLADGQMPEEKMGMMADKADPMMKPSEDDMSDDDLKKLLAEYMG